MKSKTVRIMKDLSQEEYSILEKYIKYSYPFADNEAVKNKIKGFIKHNGSWTKALSEGLNKK